MNVDPEIAWLAGLGQQIVVPQRRAVVSIVNRCKKLLTNFIRVSVEKLRVEPVKKGHA